MLDSSHDVIPSWFCVIFDENHMPYHGDSPAEAWEYWFDGPPSDTVRLALERHSKDHPAATIIEAIEITSDKLDITAETSRLQYLNGVIRRKVLESVDPERAEQERKIAIIQRCWNKSNWVGGSRIDHRGE